jgi:transcriptional regulator with XRE-family HTH domain
MRKRQGLSQAELAKRVGVTSSSISQVEGNQIYPSLSTLIKIADVLTVDVRSFFRESESIGKRIVFQASEAVEVKSKSVAENIRIRRLTPVDFQGKGEAYLVEMPPDASVSGHFLDCKGEEMGCVLSGEISFRLEEFDHTCREEDVISLTSATPHGWWNAGSTAARLFWIVIR